MRKFTLALAATFAAISSPALATQVQSPTLHGFCSLGSICTDNGTNTPTTVNPPVFGFAASPGPATGTLWIDILVPNSVALNTLPVSFTISPYTTSTLSGTASLFSSTAWTSGQLDSFLHNPASPTNPIGAFLGAAQSFQPTATGFYVFQANLGLTTLMAQSSVGTSGQDAYLMQLGQSLAQGSYIVGFLDQGGRTDGATANSGAIFVTNPPPSAVPEPATWAMMLAGFGATGFAMRRTRRKNLLAQIA